MPIIIRDIEQGSTEWKKLRCGVVSASKFNRIISPKECKSSKSAEAYAYEIAGEIISGEPTPSKQYGSMSKGTEREQEAREYFELTTGLDVEQVAFVFLDESRRVGCSPDGLIGDDAGFETKNKNAHVQIRQLENGWDYKTDHWCQVQGCLWVTGRGKWYLQSYSRGIKSIVHCIERDEKFIEALSKQVFLFNERVDKLVERWG